MSRIALISDLHANQVALDAVLLDIRGTGADEIICLGDVATLGPKPREVIETLRQLGCPCITGNHDAFLLEPKLIESYTEAPVIAQAVDWCRSQLSQADLAFLRTFEAHLQVELDQTTSLFLYHGSPRSHMEDILCSTPPELLDEMLGGHEAPIMAGGHTHIQMLRQHRGVLVVNPGSVGLAFKEFVNGREPTLMDHAEYALIEAVQGNVSVALRRVALDRKALFRAATASDNPIGSFLAAQYA